MRLDTWIALVTAIGEVGIVAVIYWEIENARLDHFLEDAFDVDRWEARREIFAAFCGLEQPDSAAFTRLVNEDQKLKKTCEIEIALLSKLGNRRPRLGPLRRRVLQWFPHSVVFLYDMLQNYIAERRKASGPQWAAAFADLTEDCLAEILGATEDGLVLLDPDQSRANNVAFERERLEQLHHQLRVERRRFRMNWKAYPIVSGSVFGFIALAHLARALMQVPARVGAQEMPIWFSWAVVGIAGVLCVWAFWPRGRHAV